MTCARFVQGGRRVLLIGALHLAAAVHPSMAADCPAPVAGDTPLVTRQPVSGGEVRFSAGFGPRLHPLLNVRRMHLGADWSAPTGTLVRAAGPGRVVSAERDLAYGNLIVIDHGNGWQTRYAQLSRMSVSAGDCVEANSVIGAVGSSGLSTGPHLHFEIWHGGEALDPMQVRIGQAQ